MLGGGVGSAERGAPLVGGPAGGTSTSDGAAWTIDGTQTPSARVTSFVRWRFTDLTFAGTGWRETSSMLRTRSVRGFRSALERSRSTAGDESSASRSASCAGVALSAEDRGATCNRARAPVRPTMRTHPRSRATHRAARARARRAPRPARTARRRWDRRRAARRDDEAASRDEAGCAGRCRRIGRSAPTWERRPRAAHSDASGTRPRLRSGLRAAGGQPIPRAHGHYRGRAGCFKCP